MNLFSEQMRLEKLVREQSKVVPIPTQKMAEELHKQGKRIVHKPSSLKSFHDDDLPPEAA